MDVEKLKAGARRRDRQGGDAPRSTPRELQKAKNQLAARAVFQRERVTGIWRRSIGVDWIVAHDPSRPFTSAAKFDAVTADDVLRVAKKYLVKTNLSMLTLAAAAATRRRRSGAEVNEARLMIVAALFVRCPRVAQTRRRPRAAAADAPTGGTTAPRRRAAERRSVEGQERSVHPAEPAADHQGERRRRVARRRRANGMLLITVPRHRLRSVDVTLALEACPTRPSRIDKTGLAQFVAGMLRKGTAKRTADQTRRTPSTSSAAASARRRRATASTCRATRARANCRCASIS